MLASYVTAHLNINPAVFNKSFRLNYRTTFTIKNKTSHFIPFIIIPFPFCNTQYLQYKIPLKHILIILIKIKKEDKLKEIAGRLQRLPHPTKRCTLFSLIWHLI
uniref:Uncharacterized protein n=1 Tax=Micrurus lemniscatus lemniscatus TaxID=129467 RepID=A0A2D4IJS8_MICLE